MGGVGGGRSMPTALRISTLDRYIHTHILAFASSWSSAAPRWLDTVDNGAYDRSPFRPSPSPCFRWMEHLLTRAAGWGTHIARYHTSPPPRIPDSERSGHRHLSIYVDISMAVATRVRNGGGRQGTGRKPGRRTVDVDVGGTGGGLPPTARVCALFHHPSGVPGDTLSAYSIYVHTSTGRADMHSRGDSFDSAMRARA